MGNEVAGPGEIFVCTDCGRRSKDRHGHQKVHTGWTHRCSHNAVRMREVDLCLGSARQVIAVRPGAIALPSMLN